MLLFPTYEVELSFHTHELTFLSTGTIVSCSDFGNFEFLLENGHVIIVSS